MPTAACGALTFSQSSIQSRPRNHHVTALANTKAGPFIYVMGGANGNASLNQVDVYPVNADGSLSPATDGPALPVATGGHTGGVVSNVMVIAGGMTPTGVVDKSYTSVIGDDGSLGPWVAGGSVLQKRMHAGSVIQGNKIWVLGGFNDPNVWDDIVSATVASDGTLSAWTPAGKLPGPLSHFSITLVGDYAYLAAGLNKSAFSNPPDLKDVWRGHILSDGTIGEWTAMPPLPTGLATHASFFYGGYLYVGGGIDNVPTQEKRIWRAQIDADHNLGAWEETAPFLIARSHVHQLPVFENHVYSFAGSVTFSLTSTNEIDIGTFQ